MKEGKYKILIADDEIWIRKNLEQMISWKEYGLEFLEPAVDGEDVLKKIEQNKPDILITDINMPFVNGVDLLNIISEKYPELVTFVISGYDNFEYVRSTLLAGAIHYLIKPVSKIDLIGALSKALNILAKREEQKLKEENQRLQLMKASSVLQDYECSKLLEKEVASFAPSFGFCEMDDFNGMYLMLIKLHNMKNISKENHYDRNLISYKIKNEIRRIAKDEDLIFNNVYCSNEFLIISKREGAGIRKIADRLIEVLPVLYDTAVTICVGKQVYSMESLHSAYDENIGLLMLRRFAHTNEVLIHTAREERQKRISFHSQENEMKLKHYMSIGNRGSLEQLIFHEFGFGKEALESQCYLEVKQNLKKMLLILAEQKLSGQTAAEITDVDNLITISDNVVDSLDYREIRQIIYDVLDLLFAKDAKTTTGSVRDMIREAVAYIDSNYFEELTLSVLSDKYGVESSYFSKVFRNETGKNLMLYIAEKRMEKAKEYMQQKDLKMTDIAFMTGYDDYSYFNRVFRKITGQSPRSFRVEMEKRD